MNRAKKTLPSPTAGSKETLELVDRAYEAARRVAALATALADIAGRAHLDVPGVEVIRQLSLVLAESAAAALDAASDVATAVRVRP